MCQALVRCTVGVEGVARDSARAVWKVTKVIFSRIEQESLTAEGESPVGERNLLFLCNYPSNIRLVEAGVN